MPGTVLQRSCGLLQFQFSTGLQDGIIITHFWGFFPLQISLICFFLVKHKGKLLNVIVNPATTTVMKNYKLLSFSDFLGLIFMVVILCSRKS